jgi:hypothetical protein
MPESKVLMLKLVGRLNKINRGNAAENKRERSRFTFPAQALPCSGSTGIISAIPGRFKAVLTLPGISTPRTLFSRHSGESHKVKEEKMQYL